MKRNAKDTLLKVVEREARAMLKSPRLKPSERLKAIELLAKVAMVRHKIEDGGEGAFFNK